MFISKMCCWNRYNRKIHDIVIYMSSFFTWRKLTETKTYFLRKWEYSDVLGIPLTVVQRYHLWHLINHMQLHHNLYHLFALHWADMMFNWLVTLLSLFSKIKISIIKGWMYNMYMYVNSMSECIETLIFITFILM